MASPSSTIRALCRANSGLLSQKINLMNAMRTTFGPSQANNLYVHICPIVQASVAQHIRHSMDHLELAAKMAAGLSETNELHYDLRLRGGPDEFDMDEAQARIERTLELLSQVPESEPRPVEAVFMLSGDPEEFKLPSTVERELGFAAHHAIHHMALVKIIALETLSIPPDALPSDFGRAPSTIVHDKTLEAEKNK